MRKKSKLALYTSRRRKYRTSAYKTDVQKFPHKSMSALPLPRIVVSLCKKQPVKSQLKTTKSGTPIMKLVQSPYKTSSLKYGSRTSIRKRPVTPSSKPLKLGTSKKFKSVLSPSKTMSLTPHSVTPLKKRPVTPLWKTPKKMRTVNIDNEWEDVEIIPVDTVQQDTDKLPGYETPAKTDSNANNDKYELIDTAFSILNEAGFGEQFLDFFELIVSKKFPLNNMSLLLFLETVRFYNCESTTQMRYSDETKRFWKSGYRLFHAKFLYFMGGPKHMGEMSKTDVYERGKYKPEVAKINFAVPSVNTLEKFRITEVDLPSKMPTGVIEPVLESLAGVSSKTAYMLCADGKKVTAGVDKAGGDVDMFGFEDGLKLNERKSRLESELKTFRGIILDLQDGLNVDLNEKQPITSSRLKEVCSIISNRIKDSRELKKKQEYGLSHFKSLGGEKWKESKYVYAISGLQASIYQLNDYIGLALETVKGLCKHIALLELSFSTFPETKTVDIAYQENMLLLKSDDTQEVTESRFLKQRTDLWFTLREKALVTGSSIHSALGLRGRKEQVKHIDKCSGQFHEDRTEEEEARLRYGTDNEINAITTLSSIVLPAYFPSCYYVEEGCYAEPGINREVCLVVSPDGSVRELEITEGHFSGNSVAAVEAKCPYPKDNTLPVHYSLPEYYVCQCLAEMYVLKTTKLLYVCYSKESSTIFEVTFDENLWKVIWDYMCEIYDSDTPKLSPKSGQTVKNIKTDIKEFVKSNVKFIVEVPSVTAEDSEVSQTIEGLPFQFPLPRMSHARVELSLMKAELIRLLESAEKSTETCYNLMRRKGTEVMVWVLTNINRKSSDEVPCSLPIAYGLKDYKLTSNAMREATNYVLKKCRDKGIRVCSFSTDGQWINLMTRNESGEPLTLLQLQKDVWGKVQKISKTELVKLISRLNIVNLQRGDISGKIIIERYGPTGITVTSKERCFATVKTSGNPILWFVNKKKITSNNDTEIDSTDMSDENATGNTEWMPEEVIQTLQSSSDQELQDAVSNINSTFYGTEQRDDDGMYNVSAEDVLEEGRTILEPDPPECAAPNDTEKTEDFIFDTNEVDINSDVMLSNLGDRVQNDRIEMNKSLSAGGISGYMEGSLSHRQTVNEHTLDPNMILLQNQSMLEIVLDKLKEEIKFQSLNTQQLCEILHSKLRLSGLTHKQLNKLYEALCMVFHCVPILRKTWNKEKKVNLITCFLHNEKHDALLHENRRTKRKTPQNLAKLCMKIIQSRKVPKAVLNAAYASFIYEDELKEWNEHASIKYDTVVHGHEKEIPFWYSYPENNLANDNLIGNSLDCSHNLTHLRVRSCTTGIGSLSSDAWKAVAASNETRLNVALVDDLLDKQSVPNARTNFCEEVENWMAKNGYIEAARVTKIIRDWYEASDTPGISIDERIQNLIQMRNFLLEGVDFGTFPPPGRYINKIPVVTFEGLLIDIDTKLQLHGFCGPYNIRSVGSLAAETMVGILQEMNPTPAVSIKARDVPALISSVVEVMTCKMNPKRGFYMRTSRGSGVYPVHESEEISPSIICAAPDVERCMTVIKPRDHEFDKPRKKKASRRIRFGTVSAPSAPSRGALPVRQFHRMDESKILGEKRLGKRPDK